MRASWSSLSSQLRDFLILHVASIHELRFLLAMRQAPNVWWTVGGAARAMAVPRASAFAFLRQLREANLLTAHVQPPELRYRFCPASRRDAELLAALAGASTAGALEVLVLLNRQAMRRARDHARGLFTHIPMPAGGVGK